MSVDGGRPDYKQIHELARKALGDDFTTRAYRRWRKTLSDDQRAELGLPIAGGKLVSTKRARRKKTEKSSVQRSTDNRLFLVSRRGTRLSSIVACDECKVRTAVSRYAKSTIGIAHLCLACQSGVFNRSFRKVDAMARGVQGGLPDTNRRRH